MKCVGSIQELQEEVAKAVAAGFENPECPEDVDLHRPVVDGFTLVSESGAPMKREPFVMDCWFDSGCPSHNGTPLTTNPPSTPPSPSITFEGVDQTRGWFYTLLAVSATVFDNMAYKRCLSLGLILDAEGKKMSNQATSSTLGTISTARGPTPPAGTWLLQGRLEPDEVRPQRGTRNLCEDVPDDVERLQVPRRLCSLDGFDPAAQDVPVGQRSALDRWILSRLHTVAKAYHENFTNWQFHKACRDLEDFMVNDVSNWYVRRSRRRLWDEADSHDKLSCQHTLHEVLERCANW